MDLTETEKAVIYHAIKQNERKKSEKLFKNPFIFTF